MRPRYALLLTLAVASVAHAQNPRSRPRRAADVAREPGCLDVAPPASLYGLAQAYAKSLRHASTAESLWVAANEGLTDTVATPVAGISNYLYTVDLSRHEYRCAAGVMLTFLRLPNHDQRSFANETRDLFESFAAYQVRWIATFRRHMAGRSTNTLAQADTIVALRQEGDRLTKLLGLNQAGLTLILVEAVPGTQRMRLAMSAPQRDSLALAFSAVPGDSANAARSGAVMIRDWLKTWPTR